MQKAIAQPEKVKKVFQLISTEGFSKTIDKIKNSGEIGGATGYSISGIVLAVGNGVTKFSPGDRVAAAGAGLANHAEFVDVPENLVMKMPLGLDFESASTVTLGGIAMQGVRRAELRMGEICVVFGAGILGLLSIQMLRCAGIRVAVVELDDSRLAVAKELGAEITINPFNEDAITSISNLTGGYGADAVLFTAATSSSEPLSTAFKMCKKKGRVILVGVVGMEVKREDIYAKELDFLVSTSYGPGRYDRNYEEKGLDYPYSYIRWTENRNMTEYLRMLDQKQVRLDKLINARYSIDNVTEAFDRLQSGERPLMVILNYADPNNLPETDFKSSQRVYHTKPETKTGQIQVALVGAGSFATGMHLPNMQKMSDKYKLRAVMNRTGFKAKTVAQQFAAEYSTTDYDEILNDPNIDLVLIATRHDSHASLTLRALEKGKNVFVEKPLATNAEDLQKIKDFYQRNPNGPLLTVGFNRRFSKYANEIKKHTALKVNPLFIHYRMNAGYVPADNWIHENGGRIVGEGCHLIDLMTYFTESKIQSISCESLSPLNDKFSSSDNKSIVLKYEDGSVCTIHYFAVGNKAIPKEYMEIHFDQKSIVLEDYKSLKGFGVKVNEIKTVLSEKGQFEELEKLYETLSGKTKNWPIELWDLLQTTEATLNII